MTAYECLICCDPRIDSSFSVDNAKSLCQTLGLPEQTQDKISSSNSNSAASSSSVISESFPYLLQSSTYCSKCVRLVKDLETVLKELVSLEKVLKQGRIQIETELRNSTIQVQRKLATNLTSTSVTNHQNQKLREKILTHLEQNKTRFTAFSSESGRLSQTYVETLPESQEDNPEEILGFGDPLRQDDVDEDIKVEISYNEDDDANFDIVSVEPPHPHSPRPSNSVKSFDCLENKCDQPGSDKPDPGRVAMAKSVNLPVVMLQRLKTKEARKSRVIRDKHEENGFPIKPRRRQRKNKKLPPLIESDKIPLIACPYKNCVQKFRTTEEVRLKGHIRVKHEGKVAKDRYECELCGVTFGQIYLFRIHNYKFHNGKCPYICSHCQEEFTTDHALKLHVAVTHKPEQIKFSCKVCNKGFVNKTRLELHSVKHMKVRPFMCEHCSKTFNTAQYLKHHQSRHHPDQSIHPPSICKECGKVFGSPFSLKGHMKSVHLKQFNHQCELCGYGCLTPSALKHHMIQRHSDDKNYKCNVCTAAYKTKAKLNLHMRAHTGERPYVCKFCSKGFIGPSDLKRHELIHTNAQCHECQFCGKTFPVRNYLYVHLKSHKNMKAEKRDRTMDGSN